MRISQVRSLLGSVPCVADVACPLNVMLSPTAKNAGTPLGRTAGGLPLPSRVGWAGGAAPSILSIETTGGVSPAVIVSGALVVETPLASVTISVTRDEPAAENVHVGVALTRLSQDPPGIVQAKVSGGAAVVEPEPSKWTVSGSGPKVTSAVAWAVGTPYSISWISPAS